MPLKFKCEFCKADIETDVFKKGDKFGCENCHKLITVPQDAEGNSTLLKKGGIYHCSLCGAVNEDSASCCSNCGSDVESISMVCVSCETNNNLEAIYCRKCGDKLAMAETKTVKYCEKCGAEYNSDDDFCEKDGSRLITKDLEIATGKLKYQPDVKEAISLGTQQSGEVERSDMVKSKGFFTRLTLGEYGLFKTFWIFGFLITFVLNVIYEILNYFMVLDDVWYLIIGMTFVGWAVTVWTGIWRAADMYKGKQVWAGLAYLSVILGIIISFVTIVGGFE